jgi:hypothetical protein
MVAGVARRIELVLSIVEGLSMRCSFALIPLLIHSLVAANVFGAEEAVPTAPQQQNSDGINLEKATPDEIKAWLKPNEKGHYTMSQFRKLQKGRPWTRSDVRKVFGEPTEPESATLKGFMSWKSTENQQGVYFVEDATHEEAMTGHIYFLTTEPPRYLQNAGEYVVLVTYESAANKNK